MNDENGLFFERIAGTLRSVYRQLDGDTILADSCTCQKDPFDCVIDRHRIAARMKNVEFYDTTV